MHPCIPELKELFRQGRVTRRGFVQNATMLGLSLSAATAFLAACAQQQAAAPQPTVSLPAQPTKAPAPTAPPAAATSSPIFALPTAVPTSAPAAAPTAAPTTAPAAGAIKRGGTIRVSTRVRRLPDPPKFSWGSDVARDVSEYLAEVDEKGIAYPHLLEKFETSDDAKTWTLFLRKGIQFNMPKPHELEADDVIWNMKRWVTKESGGSMAGLMDYLKPTGIEKVDKYTTTQIRKTTSGRTSVQCDIAKLRVPPSSSEFLRQSPSSFTIREKLSMLAAARACRSSRRNSNWWSASVSSAWLMSAESSVPSVRMS
ncbi:MAG: hypothetical protein HY331_06510 [Chloroflexi bacterium]|nr:hypothetical protein [Chloroflexota bacterium]